MELRGGQLAYNIWIKLPSEVRHNLVVLFDISRSGRTIVEYRAEGAVVTSDGYTPTDIEAITLEKMQMILGSTDENFYSLFSDVVDNLDSIVTGTYHSVKEIVVTTLDEKKPFCDSCTSKGVKHLKVCPKNKKNQE